MGGGKADKNFLVWISLKEIEDRKKTAAAARLRKDAADGREMKKQMRLDAGLQQID